MERFKHYVWAGGGSNIADLCFADDGTAFLEHRCTWMGAEPRSFRLRFRVKHFSERYGLLALTEAERLDAPQRWSASEINEATCGFNEDEEDDSDEERMLYWGVAYEFLKLDGGETHVPNDPHLLDLCNAEWNRRMDLVLFARALMPDAEHGGLDSELASALASVDRLKFERILDASTETGPREP